MLITSRYRYRSPRRPERRRPGFDLTIDLAIDVGTSTTSIIKYRFSGEPVSTHEQVFVNIGAAHTGHT
jgi:hypothetical protein